MSHLVYNLLGVWVPDPYAPPVSLCCDKACSPGLKTLDTIEDKKIFFKSHPRKGKRKQRWHFVDKNGKVVWL